MTTRVEKPPKNTKTTTRTRSGCIHCKKRKKKCDEIKPICTGCFKRNVKCEYKAPQVLQENEALEHRKNPQTLLEFLTCDRETLGDTVMEILLMWKNGELPILMEPYENEAVDLFGGELSNYDTLDGDHHHSWSLDSDFLTSLLMPSPPISPSLQIKLPVLLNSSEITYFEYYCKEILPNLSLLPQQFNHYSKIYFPIAFKEKSVLYCLILWGCKHLNDHRNTSLDYQVQNQEAQHFTDVIANELNTLKSEDVLCKGEFICGFVSCLLLVCMETSFGDTINWPKYFTDSFNLLNKMPGNFKYLLNECGSTDGSVLAENFAYFDVLASQSNENGTFYSIDDYSDVFQMNVGKNFTTHDPLQGCIRPLILQIGKIVSLLVEYDTLKLTVDLPECDKFALVSEMLRKAEVLDKDIRFTKPDLSCLMDSNNKNTKISKELEFHLTLFEIFQISSQLYLKQVIRKLPPMVPEIEMLFYNLREDLKIMITSSMFKKSLAFPMLMLGICACGTDDRNSVKSMFEELIQTCGYLSSYYKIWVVIQKIWEINEMGTINIDWFKITKQLGWKLSLAR